MGAPILFANVALYRGGQLVKGVQSDFDGKYIISEIDSGSYDLEVSYVGYAKCRVEDIHLIDGQIEVVDVVMKEEGLALDEVEIKSYKRLLFRKGRTGPQRPVREEEIRSLGLRSVGHTSTKNPGSKRKYKVRDGEKRQREWNTEDYDRIVENPFRRVSDEALSTFSVDVDGASYSNVRRMIENGQRMPRDAVRVEEFINYFDYDYPQPTEGRPFELYLESGECPWNPEHQLVHIGLQGRTIEKENLPPANLVFLIDVSGSMSSSNKLGLVKASLEMLVEELRPEDQVSMVVYAGAAGLVLPPTSGSDKQTIKNAIGRLSAGGSTAGAHGIQHAYEIAQKSFLNEGNNRVILATDGDFNVGVSSDAELVRLIEEKRKSGVFLTVLGYGMGNYKDNKMQKLANKGNGNHAYIDDIFEAKKVLVDEFGGMFTIAKDVKIQIEFNPQVVEGYRLVGYENRILNKEDFNDDTKDAGEIGAGHTVTALYEIIPSGTESDFLSSVDELKYQSFIPKENSLDEMLTIKLRYKQPAGKKSALIERSLNSAKCVDCSDNYNWAAAVAAYGMVLRDSKYKQDADLEMVKSLARSSKGADSKGLRADFLNLVDISDAYLQKNNFE